MKEGKGPLVPRTVIIESACCAMSIFNSLSTRTCVFLCSLQGSTRVQSLYRISLYPALLCNLTHLSLFALYRSACPFRNLQGNSFLVDKEAAALLRRFTKISSLLIDTNDVCVDKEPPAIDIQLGPTKLYIPTSRPDEDVLLMSSTAAIAAKHFSGFPEGTLDLLQLSPKAPSTVNRKFAGNFGEGLVCGRGDL